MDYSASVKASFWMTGYEFDIDEATRIMKMPPTWASRREDAPPGAIRGTCWVISTEKEESDNISIQLGKLLKMVEYHRNAVMQFCADNLLEMAFVVNIYYNEDVRPVVSVPAHQLKFIASIGADLDFDLLFEGGVDSLIE